MSGPEIAVLLRLLEEAFEKQAWHGPNLKGSLRGVTAAQAAWAPGPGRHSIWPGFPFWVSRTPTVYTNASLPCRI